MHPCYLSQPRRRPSCCQPVRRRIVLTTSGPDSGPEDFSLKVFFLLEENRVRLPHRQLHVNAARG